MSLGLRVAAQSVLQGGAPVAHKAEGKRFYDRQHPLALVHVSPGASQLDLLEGLLRKI